MAYGRIRTNAGHGAGKRHGRWMPRADAKVSSAKKRRSEDKAETQRQIDAVRLGSLS